MKKLIYSSLLIYLFLVLFNFPTYGQIEEPGALKGIIPASPTAQELGKYGEVPVSLYNGLTQISIPLMEADALHLSLPISLSYHSSGIKVEQVASWVGLGWSLDAGGVITREVRDQPDDAYSYTGGIYCDRGCNNICYNCNVCGEGDESEGCLECGSGSCYRDVAKRTDSIGYLYNGPLIDALYHDESYSESENLFLHGSINRIYYALDYEDMQPEDIILDVDVADGPENYGCLEQIENAVYALNETGDLAIGLATIVSLIHGNNPFIVLIEQLLSFLNDEFDLDHEHLPYINLDEFFAEYPELIDCLSFDVLRPTFDVYDTEPDVFSFNFNGNSGQFVFDKNGEPKLFSEQDLKITYTLSQDVALPSADYADLGMNSVFGGGITEFNIVTPDGTTYVFNEREISVGDDRAQSYADGVAVDYINECSPPLRQPYRIDFNRVRATYTAWYLSEVINHNGVQEFQFHYDKEVTIDHNNLTEQVSVGCDGNKNVTFNSVVNTTLGKRLSRIEWGDIGAGNILGALRFDADLFRFDMYYPDDFAADIDAAGYNQAKALRLITWEGADGTDLRQVEFSYENFEMTDIEAHELCNIDGEDAIWLSRHRHRPKLTSLTERGWAADGTPSAKPPYTFDYDDTPLPPRHSPQKDFWGYYNGSEATSLIPTIYAYPDEDGGPFDIHNHYELFHTIYSVFRRLPAIINQGFGEIVNYDGMNRNADENFATAGILTQINYPTGGFTHFEYGLNEFLVQDIGLIDNTNVNLFGGGIRIEKIYTSEGMARTFDYSDDSGFFSSGKLIDMPLFAESYDNQCSPGEGGGVPPGDLVSQTRISSGALTGLLTTKGGFVGYEKVIESYVGDEDLTPNIGSITNHFNIPAHFTVSEDECNNGDCIFSLPTIQANITPPYADFYPYPPRPNYDWNRGDLRLQITKDADGNPVKEVTNTYEIFDYEKIYALKISAPMPQDVAHLQTFALGKYYFLSGDKRLVSTEIVEYMENGTVEHIKTIGYGPNHHFPTSITTSNDEVSQSENIKYAQDLSPFDGYNQIIRGTMINRYMIGIPLITTTSGAESSGSRTDYYYFNGTDLYPKKFKRKLKDGTWELLGTVTEYNTDGFPTVYQPNNYTNTITYSWDNDRMTERDYITWSKGFTYDPNTRLQTSMTEIDGQTTIYDHDGLQRLMNISSRGGGVNTRITYAYQSQGGLDNEVRTYTSYSDTDNQEQVKRYDGLGRYTETVNIGYGVNHEDVVVNEVSYDGAGRPFYNFDYQTGGVLTTFDDSPLNRRVKETFADNSKIQYHYFANETGDINGVASGTLYKTEIIDENDHSTFSFTDFMDRQHMLIDAEGGETKYGFDGFGHLETVTSPEGELYDYVYNNFLLLESKSIPGGGTTTYTYYPNHLLDVSTNANGDAVKTIYDEYNRPTIIQLNSEDIILNTYDEDRCGNTTTGQLTRKDVKVLGENQFLITNYCYDNYGRVTFESSDHYLDGHDEYNSNYDMADNLLARLRTHHGPQPLKIGQDFDYDHSFRLKENKQAITDDLQILFDINSFQTLSYFNYNNKDQIIQKNLHRISGDDFLQQIDYRYNSRAWLTQINTVDEAPTDVRIPSCQPIQTTPCGVMPHCGDRTVGIGEILKMRLLNKDLAIECYQPCDTVSLCDYIVDYSWGHFDKVDSVKANGSVIPLPNYPYWLQYDSINDRPNNDPLTTDIKNWLIANGYQVSDVTQTTDVRNGRLTIFQTDFSAFDAIYSFDVSHNQGVFEDLFYTANCRDSITCDTIDTYCGKEETKGQDRTLSKMREQLSTKKAKDLHYPTELNRVRLCTQEEIYLLNEELPLLTGGYQILQKVALTDPGQELTVTETTTTTTSEASNEDLFSMRLYYHQSSAQLDAPSQRNGNISHMKWKVRDQTTKAYGFRYDRINRLKKAKYSELIYNKFTDCVFTTNGRYDVWNINYDMDGNLLNLFRKGVDEECPNGSLSFGEIDMLFYTNYTGNRLDALRDDVAAVGGVTSAINQFTYDNNGNITSHTGKGISNIDYNYLSLPELISFAPNQGISITYDAEGRKLRKQTYDAGFPALKYYINGIEYSNAGGGLTIEGAYHEEGRMVPEGGGEFSYEYNLRDHLGNTRVIFSDLNDNNLIETSNGGYSEVLQEDHYYPFGMNMKGNFAAQVGTENAYQYNGKELNEDLDLNWNDYGARWYDAAIARFTGVDPLSEKFAHISPFNYASNNPIRYFDLWGLQGADFNTGEVDKMIKYFNLNSKRGRKSKHDCMTCHIKGIEILTDNTIPKGDNSDKMNSINRQRKQMQEKGLANETETIIFKDEKGKKAADVSKIDAMDGSLASKATELSKDTENSVFGVSIADGYHTMTLTVNNLLLDGPTLSGEPLVSTTFILSDQGTNSGTFFKGNVNFNTGQKLDQHLLDYIKGSAPQKYPAKIEIHQIINPNR